MDLWKHKYEVHKKKVKKQGGFTLIIVPHYQGKTVRIVLTPLRIYTILFTFALIVTFAVSFGASYRELLVNAKAPGVYASSLSVEDAKNLQALQDELAKTKADVEALRQYVLALGKLEKDVRSALKLGGETVSLESILARPSSKSQIQSYTELPKTYAQVRTELADTSKQAVQTEQTLTMLQETVYKFNEMKAQTPDYWPLQGSITSYFGWRISPFGGGWEFHKGIDIASYYGAPIRAAADGEVTFAGWDSGGYGKMIIIYHRDGIETVYGHLSGIDVKVGDKVKKGQVIGYEGCTGLCTGPHLHFEIRVWGEVINPLKYLE
ncbi:peptidoglycan DD-metalloendopeptidase family protein [Caldisericum exile]|uniref:Peptidase M23 family protein n=1 Tax=Caldisericum exile (strain DSM 21853 / NBRC 104410 / AZM16c01) TaxID=511051 RepID=A0A7U6JFC2_CALEA|nr:peptidoglycan DD-metalloendopeptidase family protein [Caldisericum exile]BAL81636.1 peptidase M23 family protein [Caldisericum exile AZM16c01]